MNQVDFQFSEDINNKSTNKKPFSVSGGDAQISPISKLVNEENKVFSLSSSVLENEIFLTGDQVETDSRGKSSRPKEYDLQREIQRKRDKKKRGNARISENAESTRRRSQAKRRSTGD